MRKHVYHKRAEGTRLVLVYLFAIALLAVGCAGRKPAPRYTSAGSDKQKKTEQQSTAPKRKRPAKSNVSSRDALEREIQRWMGTPYKWGGNLIQWGADCSGYAQAVMENVYGLQLPRTSSLMYDVGKPVRKDQLQRGDLVFFNTSGKGISHVGIYIGDGNFTHVSINKGVTIDPLTNPYYKVRYVGAKRVVSP